MKHADALRALMLQDPERMRMLALVRALDLPDCWIGAGFVRNAVWDQLHGRAPAPPAGDVDIIWFDPHRASAAIDTQLEQALRQLDATVDWSVKNQCRMHTRNDDAPYASAVDAMRGWPETATAAAVRLDAAGSLEFAAPFGLEDLFDAILRPGPRFHGEKHPIFEQRVALKAWRQRWPLLQIVAL
jgi:hypothetical protein